jgi:hypothetical protein
MIFIYGIVLTLLLQCDLLTTKLKVLQKMRISDSHPPSSGLGDISLNCLTLKTIRNLLKKILGVHAQAYNFPA